MDDPNKERNDPMVPEYWSLGEDFQDQVRAAGYEPDAVEGIAVDIHDLLQAADMIRSILESDAALGEKLAQLSFEVEHVRWHCDAASAYLRAAREAIGGTGASQSPPP